MSDKLAAASLLLTLVAILYSLWYSQLVTSLNTIVPRFPADRRRPLREVSGVFWRRAVPLTLAAWSVALVFLPDAAGITIQSLGVAGRKGLAAVRDYDSVATAFVLVEVISISFAVYFGIVLYRFRVLVAQLAAGS